ncbi:MAG: glycosyltransferase family 39 protein, partial [bacterium]
MFYYLTLARNVALGHGATADGENATNGFHPLWVIVLVPLFRLLHNGAEPQWALVLLTLFSVSTAWFIYKILRFSCGEIPSFVAAVIWLGSPYTVLITLSGVEAPLFVLLASAAVCFYLKIAGKGAVRNAPLSQWIFLGVLMGAAVLARIDGALLAAIVFLDGLIGKRGNATPWRKRFTQACFYGVACAFVTLPWFIWSYSKTGLLFQMSGKAIYHQQHVIFWSQYRDVGAMSYFIGWCANLFANARAAMRSITVLCGVSPGILLIAVLLFALLLIIISVRNRPLAADWLKRSAAFSFLYAYGLIVFVLYSAYLWYSQDWYYYSMVFVGCIAAGCLFDLLDGWLILSPARYLRSGLWAVFLACVVFIFSRQC